jgi:hypothetical protein
MTCPRCQNPIDPRLVHHCPAETRKYIQVNTRDFAKVETILAASTVSHDVRNRAIASGRLT